MTLMYDKLRRDYGLANSLPSFHSWSDDDRDSQLMSVEFWLWEYDGCEGRMQGQRIRYQPWQTGCDATTIVLQRRQYWTKGTAPETSDDALCTQRSMLMTLANQTIGQTVGWDQLLASLDIGLVSSSHAR